MAGSWTARHVDQSHVEGGSGNGMVVCGTNGRGEGRVGRLWHSYNQKSARLQGHFETHLHEFKSLNRIVIHKLSTDFWDAKLIAPPSVP